MLLMFKKKLFLLLRQERRAEILKNKALHTNIPNMPLVLSDICRRARYIRAHALGKLKSLCQCLGVKRWGLWTQGRQSGLRGICHRRLDYAVQAA